MCEGSQIRGKSGKRFCISIALFATRIIAVFCFFVVENPLWITPNFLIFALYNRSKPPIHKDKSGFLDFLTKRFYLFLARHRHFLNVAKGFTVVLAPIHNTSISCSNANFVCRYATSVAINKPVSALAFCNHFSQFHHLQIPYGRVRGFQIPAR